jgi:hypothetical protein
MFFLFFSPSPSSCYFSGIDGFSLSHTHTHVLDKIQSTENIRRMHGRVREGSTYRIRWKKQQIAGGTLSALVLPPGRRHQRLAYLGAPSLIRRRRSPAAPTYALRISELHHPARQPRLSPKSKSHAHPARGGWFPPSIYRQKLKVKFFRSTLKIAATFFHSPLFQGQADD